MIFHTILRLYVKAQFNTYYEVRWLPYSTCIHLIASVPFIKCCTGVLSQKSYSIYTRESSLILMIPSESKGQVNFDGDRTGS